MKQVAGKLYTVAIGIGKYINTAVLREIAGENGTVITFKTFEELASALRAVRKKVCGTLPTILLCSSVVKSVAYCSFIIFVHIKGTKMTELFVFLLELTARATRHNRDLIGFSLSF